MPYRSDIEGLRGVAVVLVLLFHLNIAALGLGLLGVDVFFVISGYLITRILLRDLGDGTFSLVGFYRRRAVRILPALLVMLMLSCIAGSLILLPDEIRSMAMSAAAAAGFVSNFFFWSGDGYFDLDEVRPLLHTWSLGVEEQFYLVYPVLLFALCRWMRGGLVPILWTATLGSLALSWLVGIDHPDAVFYLLPSRGWELGIGAIAAAGGLPAIRAAWARALLSAGALAVVLTASLALHGLPGWHGTIPAPGAIPACAAAALLLAYGEGTPSARLLSLAPLRWIGRISYSLYLWHFPLITLYRMGFDSAPGPLVLAALAVASVAAGALSYRFVETPFRRRFRDKGNPRAIVAGGIIACAAVALAGAGLALASPFVRPLPPDIARIAGYADYRGGAEFDYQFGPVECYGATQRYDAERCLIPDPSRRNILVIGDSYAAHLWRAVAERFPGDKVMLAASGGCRPLIKGRGLRLCRDMFERVMRDAIGKRRVQAVVLAAHWGGGELPLLAPTIRAIREQGIAVTVVGPVMGYHMPVPRLAAITLLNRDPAMAERERLTVAGDLDPLMRAIAEAAGARYYSLYDRECPAGRCGLLTRSGAPFHFDAGHLTLPGARELVEGMSRP